MSFNNYQSPYSNKLNLPQNQNHIIANPALHYQSNLQKPVIKKTLQIPSPTIYTPSSINQNGLNVTPKHLNPKLSSFNNDKGGEIYKTSELLTAKSMVFMGSDKPYSANFNTKSRLGGLGKLQLMARKVNNNFDDSKGVESSQFQQPIQVSANNQEEKQLSFFKKYSNLASKQSPTSKNGFLKPPSNTTSNFSNNNDEKTNVYKSFIHNNASSTNQKSGGFQFLMKFKKQQQQKKQRQLDKNNHNSQRRQSLEQFPPNYNNFDKNHDSSSSGQHHKLFHQYSAPSLGHLEKKYHYEPVQIFNNKYQPTTNYDNNRQFQSPVHNAGTNVNKYSSPVPGPTFMKKFNSDKIQSNRFGLTKISTQDLYVKTSTGSLNNQPSYGKILNFAKKQKKTQPQSLATTQENTPNKQKFVPTSIFLKNRADKVYSQTKPIQPKQYVTPKSMTPFSKSNNSYLQEGQQYQSPNIKSTLSDDGSGDSIQYMSDDFASQEQKQWNLCDFELGDKLGKGAFGDVFIAREKKLGLMCVLKKMSKKRIKQQKRQQHVIRQLKIQLYLNHKHLTSMYGYFHDKDNIYLILQYLPDGNLAQIKRRKKTSQGQTAQIIKEVCQGLSYMHKYSVIHRDIKPQNIFVNQGYMKLGDFGCSIFTNQLRQTVVSCLQYSSPQQLNNGYYNQKIDVWGVGILAFQLLTGKSPFQNKIFNMTQNITQGINQQIDFSDLKFPEDIKISDLAKDFIMSLLTIDPIQRLDIDQALQHKFITSNVQEVAQFQ